MIIFVCVGTSVSGFQRLAQWVVDAQERGLLKGSLFFQTRGLVEVRSGWVVVETLEPDEYVESMRRADVVITHGGVSALQAMGVGKVPIIVPRRPELGEVVDNHQIEFAMKLAAGKRALCANTFEEFCDAAKCIEEVQSKVPAGASEPKLLSHLSLLVAAIDRRLGGAVVGGSNFKKANK
jgi:UDP-N-acetylglucosamine transferase subunit ALG13